MAGPGLVPWQYDAAFLAGMTNYLGLNSGVGNLTIRNWAEVNLANFPVSCAAAAFTPCPVIKSVWQCTCLERELKLRSCCPSCNVGYLIASPFNCCHGPALPGLRQLVKLTAGNWCKRHQLYASAQEGVKAGKCQSDGRPGA